MRSSFDILEDVIAQSQQSLLIAGLEDDPRLAIEPLSAVFFSRTQVSLLLQAIGETPRLCIAQNLLELMGGVSGFKSELGQGSTFWFTLPIAEPESS